MFQDQRLSELAAYIASGEPVFRMRGERLWIVDPSIAREILRNASALYVPHSDFFSTSAGTFGPRATQVAMANHARALVEAHIAKVDLPAIIDSLSPISLWPRKSSELICSFLGSVIAADSRSAQFQAAYRRVLEARIFARTPETVFSVSRLMRRFSYAEAFAGERRMQSIGGAPRDLLDVVFFYGSHAADEQLIEVYTSFVFAILSSVSLVLAWSVLLSATRDSCDEDPRHIVSEALRLYPIAWLLERRAAVEHELAGERVPSGSAIAVCPYAIHRSPRSWDRPDAFEPSRWRNRADRMAWLPFGAGPHVCIAVELTLNLVSTLLKEIFARFRGNIQALNHRPRLTSSLVPPSFYLKLERR